MSTNFLSCHCQPQGELLGREQAQGQLEGEDELQVLLQLQVVTQGSEPLQEALAAVVWNVGDPRRLTIKSLSGGPSLRTNCPPQPRTLTATAIVDTPQCHAPSRPPSLLSAADSLVPLSHLIPFPLQDLLMNLALCIENLCICNLVVLLAVRSSDVLCSGKHMVGCCGSHPDSGGCLSL
jgi:hypothetical protein